LNKVFGHVFSGSKRRKRVQWQFGKRLFAKPMTKISMGLLWRKWRKVWCWFRHCGARGNLNIYLQKWVIHILLFNISGTCCVRSYLPCLRERIRMAGDGSKWQRVKVGGHVCGHNEFCSLLCNVSLPLILGVIIHFIFYFYLSYF